MRNSEILFGILQLGQQLRPRNGVGLFGLCFTLGKEMVFYRLNQEDVIVGRKGQCLLKKLFTECHRVYPFRRSSTSIMASKKSLVERVC
jgi:hypothetical protein